jgi:hypothetical protein
LPRTPACPGTQYSPTACRVEISFSAFWHCWTKGDTVLRAWSAFKAAKIVLNFLYCGFNGMQCGNGIPKQSRLNTNGTVVLRHKTGANEKFKTFCSCFWPWQGLCVCCVWLWCPFYCLSVCSSHHALTSTLFLQWNYDKVHLNGSHLNFTSFILMTHASIVCCDNIPQVSELLLQNANINNYTQYNTCMIMCLITFTYGLQQHSSLLPT